MTMGTMSAADRAGDGDLGRAGEGGAVLFGEEVITTCEVILKNGKQNGSW